MVQLAVVYRTDEGKTFVALFNDEGDVGDFMEFTSDRTFDSLDLDKFGICKFQNSDESDFRLDMLAQVQVMINPKHTKDGENSCTTEKFMDDPEREPDSFKIMYQGIIDQMREEGYLEDTPDDRVLH